jgi:hypothetical protein
MPPTHLLRLAFETCPTYAAAKALLTETPIAVPAFFSLSGTKADEGCVIERTEREAFVREGGNVSVANHWIKAPISGRSRGFDSHGRFARMEARRDGVEDGFDWVVPPIFNQTTRLAVTANAATGRLRVRGYEMDGAATRDFIL